MSVEMKTWIGEVPVRAVKTVLVKARTFKEAQEKLARGEDVEGVNVNYGAPSKGRIICEDGALHKKKEGA